MARRNYYINPVYIKAFGRTGAILLTRMLNKQEKAGDGYFTATQRELADEIKATEKTISKYIRQFLGLDILKIEKKGRGLTYWIDYDKLNRTLNGITEKNTGKKFRNSFDLNPTASITYASPKEIKNNITGDILKNNPGNNTGGNFEIETRESQGLVRETKPVNKPVRETDPVNKPVRETDPVKLVYNALMPMLGENTKTSNATIKEIYREILRLCEVYGTHKITDLIREYALTFPYEKCQGPDDVEFWNRLYRWLRASLLQGRLGINLKEFRTLKALYAYCLKNLSLEDSKEVLWAWLYYTRPRKIGDRVIKQVIRKMEYAKVGARYENIPETSPETIKPEPEARPVKEAVKRAGDVKGIDEVITSIVGNSQDEVKAGGNSHNGKPEEQRIYNLLASMGWDGKPGAYDRDMLASMVNLAGGYEKLGDFLEDYIKNSTEPLRWGENVDMIKLLGAIEHAVKVDITQYKTLDELEGYILSNEVSPARAEKLIGEWWLKVGINVKVNPGDIQKRKSEIIKKLKNR
jgi:hypothetical protein